MNQLWKELAIALPAAEMKGPPLGGSRNRLVALSPFQILSSLKVQQSFITINCAPQRMPVSRPISSISACRQWDISSLRCSEQCLYGTKVEIPDPQRPDFWRVAYEVKGTVTQW